MPLNKDIYVTSGRVENKKLILERSNNAGDVDPIDLSAIKPVKKNLTWYNEE